MNPVLQWAIPIIVGILTFFAGRSFERHKLAQANRLKLLESIEEWGNVASRLVGIIGGDVSAVASGLQFPVTYSPSDRLETAKALSEKKEKVFGILKSKVLNTRSTKQASSRLSDLVVQLSTSIEQEYLQADVHLLDKMNLKKDPTVEIVALLATTSTINILIQEIHSCLSQLKVRFT
jgi:hypothetical protein